MNNSIIQAQCVQMKELNHLFIDVEYVKEKSTGLNVYRSRSFNQKNKKYLQLDEIKDALQKVDKTKLKYIYLTGKNSMSHPEFNHILRLCLTYCSVTIFSDGSCINDKKARFLKRVEEEGVNEIIFKIFLNHYDEKQNDEISGRGSFRKAIHAISALNKYGFNPILVINTPQQLLAEYKAGFTELGKKFKFETDDINFSFLLYNQTPENENSLLPQEQWNFDCMNSRMLSKSGIYNCFSLLNDYRGRSGANLCDFSKKCYMETEKCRACKYFGQQMYANNWV